MVLVNNLTTVSDRTRYLKVHLEGTTSNRSGIGARVELTTDIGTYVQVMDGKSGYLSQSSMPLYFGLGDAGKIEEIRVLWPSGKEQVIPDPGKMNTLVVVEEPSDGEFVFWPDIRRFDHSTIPCMDEIKISEFKATCSTPGQLPSQPLYMTN